MIKVQNIYYKYQVDQNWVLEDLSFELARGDCLALLGESGSGKSTCLKLINRLLELKQGQIEVDGKNIKDYKVQDLRKKVSYVFQKGLVFPHLTVEENISLPLESSTNAWREHSNSKEKQSDTNKIKLATRMRAKELLELMELDPELFAQRYPHELSGGQAQRVSIAQAMAIDPEILLMDEPFNGLDSKTKYSLMKKIQEIKNEFQKTIILVTHDKEEAEFLASKILDLSQSYQSNALP